MNPKELEGYEKLAKEAIVPTPDQYKTYDTDFDLSGGMFAEFTHVDYCAIEDKMRSIGSSFSDMLSEDEYLAYNKTMVYSRVAWVNNDYYIIHPNDNVAVPAFLDNVLKNLGKAEDLTTGITLRPVISSIKVEGQTNAEKEKSLLDQGLLSKQRCLEIAKILRSIPGITVGKGYIKDRSGTFGFMSMQTVGDYIKNNTAQHHPVMALLASIVEPHLVCEALSPTVRYGGKNHLRGLLWEVTSV